MGTTITRMMNAVLVAPLARYLYQGRDRRYQESLMPPAKNTSAPQTCSTSSTCSTNYSDLKPTSWFHSLTIRLKMLVPHSQCLAPKHINTQERIIYPLQISHYYVGSSKVFTTLDTYLINLVVTLSVPRLISQGYLCRVQGKVHHYFQMN